MADVLLVMFKTDGERREFPLTKSRVVIGRTNHCDLRVPLSSVSRQHCEILLQDDETVSLRDLGSSNGTFHNGARVQEARISAGDEIGVGPVVFKAVIDGQPADLEPPPAAEGAEEQAPTEPETLEAEDDAFESVEPESHSPTVDLDDPIAALESMSGGSSGDDDEEEALPMLEDDWDDDENKDR